MATIELLPLRDLQACCAPITGEVISEENAISLARALKALADPARLRLLSMIAAHEDGEACVCDLTEPLALSQPTVSHHLKILTDAGFLTRSKRGTWAYYRIVPGARHRHLVLRRRSGPGQAERLCLLASDQGRGASRSRCRAASQTLVRHGRTGTPSVRTHATARSRPSDAASAGRPWRTG